MPRRIHRHLKQGSMSLEIIDLVKLWLLRLLVPLRGHKKFISTNGFDNDTLAELLGLGDWLDDKRCEFDQRAVLAELKKIHRESESTLRDTVPPKSLAENISRLSAIAGLSETDCRILEFTVFLHCESLMDETADYLGQLTSGKVYHVLSVLLELPEKEVRNALSSKGVLAGSGLVTVDANGCGFLKGKLNLLSNAFADTLLYSDADPVTLLRDIVAPSSPSTLSRDDFNHILPSLNVLYPYLRHTLETHRQGVNIFLYGRPGTGKTELCRLLAEEMNCELFEVASEDDDGDPVKW